MNLKQSTYKFLDRLGIIELPTENNIQQKNDFVAGEYRGGFWDWQDVQNHLGWPGYTDRRDSNKYKSFAYACIKKRAENIAKAQSYVYREFKSKKTEIKDHPLLKVFRGSNIYDQSYQQLLFLTSVNLDLFGDAYWQIVFLNSAFGKIVTEIRLHCAKDVTVIYNKDNTLIEYYDVNGVRFNKDEIIHFKYPNPYNNHCGYAPVGAFNFTLDIEYLQGRFSKNILNNNANIEGYLWAPGNLGGDKFERLQEQWSEKYSKGNKGKVPVLEGGMEYVQTQANPKEMDYAQTRLLTRDEICVILDVPKSVMSITDDVNYSNSQSAMRSFIENTLQPFCKVVIASQINAYFRKIYGDRFLLTMEYEFDTDRDQQLQTLDLYLRHKLIKKEILAEQEGYSASDVPEEQPILELTPKDDESIESD